LHSMSKSFNMTGWRLGFVAGNPLIVKAYADVKDNTDSGQFLAIQEACAYSLDRPEITQKIAAKYSRRMDGLVGVLNRFGFNAKKPKGSFFLYVRAPKSATAKTGQRVAFENAEAFSQWMISEKPAVGGPEDSPDFLNAAVQLTTTLSPHALMKRLLEIEREMGRTRDKKWEPRPIDLDLLLFGDQIISDDTLIVPHPLMHER